MVKTSMKKSKEAIKKQFDKKKQNTHGLKQRDSMWLEVKISNQSDS